MSDKKDEITAKLEATLGTLKQKGAELGGKLRETFEHASEDAKEAWEHQVKPRISKAEEAWDERIKPQISRAEKAASEAAERVGSSLNEATEDALGQLKKKFGELRDEVRDEFGKRTKSDA